MEIPYNVKSHEETGLYNAKFGIWLFLASEIMLFGALFSSYILLRVGSVSWPVQHEMLSVPIGMVNSVILVTSSLFIIRAHKALTGGDVKRFKMFMWLTVLFALCFLSFKGYEYAQHFIHHEYPRNSVFLALYFLMTGVHAIHIIGGVAVIVYLICTCDRFRKRDAQWFTNRVEVVGLYWHFVDIVWIFLFPTLYLF